jgi:hypothetical protein
MTELGEKRPTSRREIKFKDNRERNMANVTIRSNLNLDGVNKWFDIARLETMSVGKSIFVDTDVIWLLSGFVDTTSSLAIFLRLGHKPRRRV